MITKPYIRSLRVLTEEMQLERPGDALVKFGTAMVLYREIMAELPRLPNASMIPNFRENLGSYIQHAGEAVLINDQTLQDREKHLQLAVEFLEKAGVDCELVDGELASKWKRK